MTEDLSLQTIYIKALNTCTYKLIHVIHTVIPYKNSLWHSTLVPDFSNTF